MDEIERQRRYKLHGTIISAGWPSVSAFARDAGYSTSYLFSIISGSLLPAPPAQKKICEMLGLSIRELKGLL